MNTMILSNAIREGAATDVAMRATGGCTYRWTDRVRGLGAGTGVHAAFSQPAMSAAPFSGAAAGFEAKADGAIATTTPGTLVWSPPT